MQNKEFEKGLHDRLFDLEEAVNTDATWLAVQAGLQPPKKKRRGLIWWWLSGGTLLLALGGWLLWPGGDIDHPGLVADSVQEAKVIATPATDQSTVSGAEPRSSSTAASSGNSPEDKAPLSSKAGPEKQVAAREGLPVAASGEQQTDQAVASSKPAPALRRPQKTASIAAVSQNNTTAQTEAMMAGVDAGKEFIRSRQAAAANVATLPISFLPVLFNDEAFRPLPPIKEPTECYSFCKSGKPGWMLGAAGGIAKPYRTIAAVNTDRTGQRTRNLAAERTLEAITTDLLAGYQTSAGWTLRGGLSYQRVNSVAETRFASTVDTIRTGITEIIINPTGDTTFINGLVSESVRTSAYNRYYNKLTTVDVPILLGKTFSLGKWRLGLEAGPVFNLLSSGSARYQLEDETFSTRADNEDLFRKRLGGISWRANIHAGLLLMPGLEANIGLTALRRERSGFEVEGSATRTAYDLIGVQVGVRRSF